MIDRPSFHIAGDERGRDVSIDLLKFLAALLITNSHMSVLYGEYGFLATGGTLGDSLFFFCSGFTLFMKPMNGVREFPDWYKRRINRIYPSILAVAFVACIFFNVHWDIVQMAQAQAYWFVSCIMLYYIALFFFGSYIRDSFLSVALLVAMGSAVWFRYDCSEPGFFLYAPEYYVRWLLFFDAMLFGAWLGSVKARIKSRPLWDVLLLLSCIAAFYGLNIVGTRYDHLVAAQYFSFLPLTSAMYFFYKVGASKWAGRLYRSKVCYFLIRFIGGLCLEIYLVQRFLYTDKLNRLFPLNIVITFLAIVVAAYLTRCLARLIAQTFRERPYDWRQIVARY